jgi:hypothetical protein
MHLDDIVSFTKLITMSLLANRPVFKLPDYAARGDASRPSMCHLRTTTILRQLLLDAMFEVLQSERLYPDLPICANPWGVRARVRK